jgi:hypothetical protein
MAFVPHSTPRVGETEVCVHVSCVALTVVSADPAVADTSARLLASPILDLGSRHVPLLSVVALYLSEYQ